NQDALRRQRGHRLPHHADDRADGGREIFFVRRDCERRSAGRGDHAAYLYLLGGREVAVLTDMVERRPLRPPLSMAFSRVNAFAPIAGWLDTRCDKSPCRPPPCQSSESAQPCWCALRQKIDRVPTGIPYRHRFPWMPG